MHETAIANHIIKEASKHGNVLELTLEIGELAHVPAHELVECLEKLVEWKISHSEIKARVDCDCGFKGPPTILERGHDSFLIECPECKELPKITSGRDITIVSVKVK